MRDEDIPTANSFATQIEDLVWDKDVEYTEAILMWCEDRGLEPEVAATLVKKSPTLKAKITLEAEDHRTIKADTGSKLPV